MRTARPHYLIKPSAGPGKLLSCSLLLIIILKQNYYSFPQVKIYATLRFTFHYEDIRHPQRHRRDKKALGGDS